MKLSHAFSESPSMSDKKLIARLDDLEIKYAFQAETLDSLNETVTKLMILLYINSHNANNEAQLARVFLKKDAFSDNETGDEVYILFYELTPHHNE